MKWIAVSLIGGIILFSISFHFLQKGMNDEKASYTVNLVKKILVGTDSLIVTDYSTLMETYTLSNGTTVAKSFVVNQLKSKP